MRIEFTALTVDGCQINMNCYVLEVVLTFSGNFLMVRINLHL